MSRWLRPGILVVILAALQLVLLEGVLEILLGAPHLLPLPLVPTFRRYYRSEEWRNVQMIPGCGRYDPELAYTLLPGEFRFANREFDNLYRVNSQGVRDDEESLIAPEIIVVGDSHSAGWGVEQDESWVHLLQEKLGRRVLNAGVPSFGTAREMRLLERLDTSALEVLVVQYCGNDYLENRAWVEGSGTITVMDQGRYRLTARGQAERTGYVFGEHTLGVARALLRPAPGTDLPEAGGAGPPDEASAFLAVLGAAPVDADAVRIVVLELNANARNDSDFVGRLATELEAEGTAEALRELTIVDLSAALDRDDYYILDSHMRPSGHAAVAARMAQVLGE